jgi:hypothetical protein
MDDTTWRELMPHGRHIFYEGDDVAEWIDEIRGTYGLDPALFELTTWRGDEIVCVFRVTDPAQFVRYGPHTRFNGGAPAHNAFSPEPWPGGFTITVAIDCPAPLLDEIYASGKYKMGS